MNVSDLVSGGIPVAAGGLFRNDQGGQLVGNDLIAVECGGVGINLKEVGEGDQIAPEILHVVARPVEQTVVRVDFHGLHILAVRDVSGNKQGGAGDGFQGEGIDFASAILVAVEHTVFITSQGIGGDADLADGLDFAGELVNGDQLIGFGDAVKHLVCGVVGHVGEGAAQVAHSGPQAHGVFVHHVENAGVSGGKNVMICNGSGVVDIFTQGDGVPFAIGSVGIKANPLVHDCIVCNQMR